MLRTVKTWIAGFRAEAPPAYTTSATFLGEYPRERLTRVVVTLADVADPNRRVTVPMTPVEARNLAAWLTTEAAYADHANEGRVESTTPRVGNIDEG
jgi:hypothetical protein